MKKFNIKQLAWSAHKVRQSKFKLLARMFMFVFVVFAVPAAATIIDNPNEGIPLTVVMCGGATYAMSMAAIGNIEDQTDYYTQGEPIAYEIGLVALDQIDNTVAFPTPNSSREMGAVTLDTGELAHKFYSHNAPTYNAKIAKGEYSVDPSKEFNLVLGNIFRETILNFAEEYAGGKFILYFRQVEESQWYVLGSYDKPVILNDTELKLDDANVAIFKFGHKSVRQFYKSVTPSWAVPVTIAADATTLAISDPSVYNLSDNTVATAITAISGVAAADVGRTLTVNGGGGDNASTIADGSVFVLVDGTTWTGNSGSSITFRIMDTESLVEISRVQTA